MTLNLKELSSIVYNEDCLQALKLYPDKYFDLAVVDPPYGININESIGRYKGQKHSGAKKVTWDNSIPTKEYFNELKRTSKDQIIWGGNYFSLPANKCFLIWDKLFSDELSFSMYELAWTSFNTTAKGFKYNPALDRPKLHPTQKPVALYDWIFNKYATEGIKILDTHLGSGSSRIAAYKAGLNFVGFEIDAEYYEKQEKRFNDFKSQLRMF
jgi:site-specific DNA-methyltransferase (adenine-specific)